MALGLFVFEMGTLPYQELQRRRDWRHERSPRVGARPATQFLGPGEDSITLQGTLIPEIAGTASSIDQLVEMANEGDDLALVDGEGNILGYFVITAIDDRRSIFLDNGVARKIDFAIDLARAD
jgi:phage protein U